MTVYLGDNGAVQIKRKSGAPIIGELERGNVNVAKRRFSLTDKEIYGELITGDQVDIKRLGGGNLTLVSGHNYPDWRGYVFIDQMGGIRLFDNFADSLVGSLELSLPLVTTATAQNIQITTRASNYSYLGRVTGYELTTERETINTTQLGDQFQKQYEAGLISGQGQLDCFFEYKTDICDPSDCSLGTEYAFYLAQLCIRLTQGADFLGRFFVYRPSGDDRLDVTGDQQAVWYDAECIVTNCTVTISPTQVIETTINFVTTGKIQLLTGVPPAFLLKEDAAFLLQEDGSRIVLAGQDV